MKTILVPSDFSIPALKALQFAINLALKTNACLVVCHIYQVPWPATGEMDYTDEELKEEARQKMADFLEGVDNNTREALKLNIILKEGQVVENICRVIEENEVALVIMGTTGGKNILKKFFGTTTEFIIKKSLCPVLAIPEKYKFNPVEQIVYAADFEHPEEIAMMQLLQVEELFGATLTVLHIQNKAQADRGGSEEIKNKIIKYLPQEKFRLVLIENNAVADCLIKHVQKQKNTLLAFTIVQRPLWQKLFHNSVTSRLLHQLQVPMLALPQLGRLLNLRNYNPHHTDIAANPKIF